MLNGMFRKRFIIFWYLSHLLAAKAQAGLRIRTVSTEPTQLTHSRAVYEGKN